MATRGCTSPRSVKWRRDAFERGDYLRRYCTQHTVRSMPIYISDNLVTLGSVLCFGLFRIIYLITALPVDQFEAYLRVRT